VNILQFNALDVPCGQLVWGKTSMQQGLDRMLVRL
jgi:hypothetical protein